MSFDLSRRRSGVVVHLTSLPGPHGLGDLGDDARRFVDWLAACGQSLWQVLPVNPVGPGHSPYQCPSAFAGSPWLVALAPLVRAGWLPAQALARAPAFDPARANYESAIPWRWQCLREAAAGFFARATAPERARFQDWCGAEHDWLDPWCLYAALKDAHHGQPWWAWGAALARRDAPALAAARTAQAGAMRVHAFVQWQFDEQQQALRSYAHSRGVCLMGDLPIFVAHDSADVWARPDLVFMDERHELTVVAGVPPDGFGPDGQRWGNPLYRWDRMASDGYAWWVARLKRALAQADLVRIDHFRGFAGYWEVPASCPTAREGRWVPGPGPALFEAFRAALGHELPVVAEDLGTITPDVIALRDGFGLPGMRIVQEAFNGWGDGSAAANAQHPFLPHHHVPHALAYSSTHDSDTARGWWDSARAEVRAFAAEYLACSDAASIHWALIRATSQSVAKLALFPLQDVLGLDSGHRMNRPGTADGNWRWRCTWPMLEPQVAASLARITTAAGRAG
jgi:4-alpha-glucanotransferase